ncbi:hypothetical protein CMV_025501 [Castanea mollissima]|uniref:Uncharacterized protein n=1 Tax=Castanea mollissima TaxID=60419 RepID=A0A8J4QED2_9ROSI|nr:hypothetical protein CMV_025501 [Castanea mollissima]
MPSRVADCKEATRERNFQPIIIMQIWMQILVRKYICGHAQLMHKELGSELKREESELVIKLILDRILQKKGANRLVHYPRPT